MGRDGRGVKGASESSIEITFMYKNQRCRERIALKPTAANLKRAEQHRAAIIYAIDTGSFDYAATFPNSKNAAKFAEKVDVVDKLEDYLEKWLDRKKGHIKASTFDGYRKIVFGCLIPWFGKRRINELKKKDVKDRLSSVDASNKRLANIQSVLRSALSDAIDDEIIEANPLANWCFKKNEPPKTVEQIDPFSKVEQEAILGATTGQAHNYVKFMFWTGLRPSELIALNWSDIDFVRGVVIINKAMTATAIEPESPKTAAGRREVKLFASAIEALNSQRQYTQFKGEEVFQNPRSCERWSDDQQIRKGMWTPALVRAKVRYRNPYQTRHTYASMMLSSGEHPMWVAKQMGHADWTMIAKVYGKWMPDADLDAGAKAEKKFGATQKRKTT